MQVLDREDDVIDLVESVQAYNVLLISFSHINNVIFHCIALQTYINIIYLIMLQNCLSRFIFDALASTILQMMTLYLSLLLKLMKDGFAA
jgi:hypothetical protein